MPGTSPVRSRQVATPPLLAVRACPATRSIHRPTSSVQTSEKSPTRSFPFESASSAPAAALRERATARSSCDSATANAGPCLSAGGGLSFLEALVTPERAPDPRTRPDGASGVSRQSVLLLRGRPGSYCRRGSLDCRSANDGVAVHVHRL